MAKKKRLVRGEDRVLGGVCSGFAEYYNTDPTPIRILWVVLTLFTMFFPGILLYLIFWIVMPDA